MYRMPILEKGYTMKPRIYDLLLRCIEDGLEIGAMRAHKYTDNPDISAIRQEQYSAIRNELHEWFDFEPDVRVAE